ncbi:MAG: 2Fe-2S iron-sulfur cluster binding domain-containing protein [Saprospiraceae bacterium]|nr:2Fe-2S iron-sulfur cluster binding domain-containing protein [Saprospiraceae bacterium]MBK9721612.1 2Fe-2S iron-sulfur cluster binding domain-containing protein [Saprospiraceae bacterium]
MEFINIYIRDRSKTDHVIELPNDPAYSLMEMLRAAELPILGTCGGMALCASCHIYILSSHKLPNKNNAEEQLLDSLINSKENSRLACQLHIHESLDQLIIEIAEP